MVPTPIKTNVMEKYQNSKVSITDRSLNDHSFAHINSKIDNQFGQISAINVINN